MVLRLNGIYKSQKERGIYSCGSEAIRISEMQEDISIYDPKVNNYMFSTVHVILLT